MYPSSISGNKQWKIIYKIKSLNKTVYAVQETLYNIDSYCEPATLNYVSGTSTFVIYEDPVSGEIWFPDLPIFGSYFYPPKTPFLRYSNKTYIIVKESQRYSNDNYISSQYHFSADLGITYINLHHWRTMGAKYRYYCYLDSMKTIQ